MTQGDPTGPAAPTGVGGHQLPRCYRHPDQETGVSCSRCGRPICPQCMIDASVGFHCPDCVNGTSSHPQAQHPQRVPTTRFGGKLTGDGRLVTKILIGINLAVFVVAAYLDKSLVNQWDLVSYVAPGGAKYGVAAGPHEWYRLLTATFLHQQPLHVASNMLALWWVGPNLERVLGRLRFLALYLVSGLAGSALVYLVAGGNAASLGASGAIFGLFGATAVLFRAARQPIGPVVALIVFNLVITFSVPGIDWRAHIGGLVAGLITGIGLMHAPRANRNLVQAATVVLMLAAIVAAVLVETARLNG
ncbi:rhomboid family intramembrane serine protease [Kitasatospora acidiphila]|uniref:Rhomboid family intramembrane serine protease n=1 Tax=Kitasatospora acidiphila TaxID=2567942 RepID=A0A540W5Q4_9ACTN|nr:rhomboid family intramembrane serine protease [Kitasatospora acidiphila]TQF04277.1 rhomboid family intramembrane serine protease [Kitasatospora acidiphila]